MIDIREDSEGLTFWVYVQPRASKAAFAGIHQNALKIRLTVPPVEGAANKQCIELLAKALAWPKSAIDIVSGQSSRHKQIRVRPKGEPMTRSESDALKRLVEKLFY
jgi:uncharacterized protein